MAARDIIVIGASAGGLEAVRGLVRGLPSKFDAAIFVVIHVSAHAQSALPGLLTKAGKLPARHPVDREPIKHGRIYVAPPDHHLLIENSRIRLTRGPRENRNRPAIDALFRTAALHHGPRVIGIILSGSLDDGSMGLKEIKMRGGLAIIQNPAEALFPDMPLNAAAAVRPDFCLNVSQIASLLPKLIRRPVKEEVMKASSNDRGMKPETKAIKTAEEVSDKQGPPSVFVCPECNGPLWEIRNGEALLYRCLVGHSYAPHTLSAAQSQEVERALWVALRALEERAELQRQLAQRAKDLHQARSNKQFNAQSQENLHHARLIRQVLENL